jgi:hypothetical protein
MVNSNVTDRPREAWRADPTTADFVRETQKVSSAIHGVPEGVTLEEAAQLLVDLRIPLQPLVASGEEWTHGWMTKSIRDREGRELFAISGGELGVTWMHITLSPLLQELLRAELQRRRDENPLNHTLPDGRARGAQA